MRVSAYPGRTNCTIEAPNFGRSDIKVETVGYGMSIVMSEGLTRQGKTFYPFVRTSGLWYIEGVFSDVRDRNQFHMWLLGYIIRCNDQYSVPLLPLTVTVPASKFSKTGYITSNIAFGDQRFTGVYRSIVQFASASDPALASTVRSNYRAPEDDKAALNFYPSGIQAQSLPPPVPPMIWTGQDKSVFDDPSMPGSTAMGVPGMNPTARSPVSPLVTGNDNGSISHDGTLIRTDSGFA